MRRLRGQNAGDAPFGLVALAQPVAVGLSIAGPKFVADATGDRRRDA